VAVYNFSKFWVNLSTEGDNGGVRGTFGEWELKEPKEETSDKGEKNGERGAEFELREIESWGRRRGPEVEASEVESNERGVEFEDKNWPATIVSPEFSAEVHNERECFLPLERFFDRLPHFLLLIFSPSRGHAWSWSSFLFKGKKN